MKPLENRAWFVFLSTVLSALIMLLLCQSVALPLNLSTGIIFMFATLGIWQGLSKVLALLLIKAKPSLGEIGPQLH